MTTYDHYALVIPPDFFQLTFRHTCALVPDEIDCTVGYTTTDGILLHTDLEQVAAAWEDNIVPLMSEDITFTKVDARTAAGVVDEVSSGATGGYTAGDSDPLNSAVVVKKLTGVAGRAQRGRFYLPIVGGDNCDMGGNLTGPAIAAITAAAEAFRADVEAGARLGTLVLLHSKGWNGGSEPADPGNAADPTTIQALVCSPKIGTQRRRLR